jgi:quercetin dioxygenase-like cupin family protein
MICAGVGFVGRPCCGRDESEERRIAMPDVTVKRLEDFEAVFGGGYRRVRAGLGVSSFGLGLMHFPPNATQHPEHQHSHDEQEEVYSVLEGRATLHVGGEEHELVPGVWARVGPTERRQITTGDEPALVLAIGATPGKPYTPPEFTEEGAPDPLKAKSAG